MEKQVVEKEIIGSVFFAGPFSLKTAHFKIVLHLTDKIDLTINPATKHVIPAKSRAAGREPESRNL